MTHRIEGFTAGDSWFPFANNFQSSIIYYKYFLPVGNASYGLCGGMVFAVADWFFAKKPIPAIKTSPSQKNHPLLLEYLKQRQIDSINLKALWTYLKLMWTSSKTDRAIIQQSWREIKQDIDQNKPVVLGLIRVKIPHIWSIFKIFQIVKNHQVLAYGYREMDQQFQIDIYDPSNPGKRDAHLIFALGDNIAFVNAYPDSLNPIYTFFKAPYLPSPPPTLV